MKNPKNFTEAEKIEFETIFYQLCGDTFDEKGSVLSYGRPWEWPDPRMIFGDSIIAWVIDHMFSTNLEKTLLVFGRISAEYLATKSKTVPPSNTDKETSSYEPVETRLEKACIELELVLLEKRKQALHFSHCE